MRDMTDCAATHPSFTRSPAEESPWPNTDSMLLPTPCTGAISTPASPPS
jgi:hypothetical protein